MTSNDIEEMYLRSLDGPLTKAESELLAHALEADPLLASELNNYVRIREAARSKNPASFGPGFSSSVITTISQVGWQIDQYLLLLFKRYQLVAMGVVVALLALNAVFAEQLTLPAIFGFDQAAAPAEDIAAFDFYEMLNTDL